MDLGLKGANILITGGSKGIGRACAERFADEGANVAICARGQAEIDAAIASLEAKGVKAFGQAVDVADKAALEAWVKAAAEALGGIDVLVANVSALAVDDSEEAWMKGFETDLMHTVRAANAALPWLEQSKQPAITIISSVSGREIDFTGPAYGGFKATLVHYAQGLAYRLAPKMIRANTVSPGNTYFEGGIWQWIEQNNPTLFKQALDLNPTGRMATADEIAKGVVFLSSPASSFTTGTNLVIDGALTKGVQL
ncbi:MAG: SDR family oxidoreductase [Geminicoccaceae bacterium]|nr:MAG: SDR family oxidoreductase [Geminicoccaceae bacterium]